MCQFLPSVKTKTILWTNNHETNFVFTLREFARSLTVTKPFLSPSSAVNRFTYSPISPWLSVIGIASFAALFGKHVMIRLGRFRHLEIENRFFFAIELQKRIDSLLLWIDSESIPTHTFLGIDPALVMMSYLRFTTNTHCNFDSSASCFHTILPGKS